MINNLSLPVLLAAALLASPVFLPLPRARATGFIDIAECFTAKKGSRNAVSQLGDSQLGECRIQFYSSLGGGTTIELRMLKDGAVIKGDCPGLSQQTYGTRGCLVNRQPGDIQVIGEEPYPAYCVWRYRDPIAYCAFPFNRRP
jgi:hypothetical protein